jgi:hypothetical protein
LNILSLVGVLLVVTRQQTMLQLVVEVVLEVSRLAPFFFRQVR